MNIDISEHIGMVKKIANKRAYNKDIKLELEQVGMMGLVLAAKRFNPNNGNKFVTYAWTTINGYILQYIRDNITKHKDCLSLMENGEEETKQSIYNIEEQYIDQEQRTRVYEFLNSYKDKEKLESFLAVYLDADNENAIQMAERLGVNYDTIRQRARVVKKHLTKAMQQ